MNDPTDIGRLARRRDFALLVTAERSDGVMVSQLYTSLTSAERKVMRAKDRGLSASMVLVRVSPVAPVTPEDLALLHEERRS